MSSEPTTTNEAGIVAPAAATPTAPQAAPRDGARAGGNRFRGGDRGGRGGPQRGGGKPGGKRGERRGGFERARPEYDHKTIDVRRVARVVAGGRRFSFAVSLVAGDRKGKVGVGTGKSGDTASAIEKAMRSAKKNAIKIALTKQSSIPHEVEAKYSSAVVRIMPAPGRGIVAGSAVRVVLDLAGITDVGAKIFSGSKNKLNIARAAIEALSQMQRPKGGEKVVAAPAEEVAPEEAVKA
ncbi:MAG: hypothetical protein A2408_01800 [Candidatus Yonathbacteria bacterium RIFOXYC1_FULL_52_10]|uniref:Small ribosomal subunit protein uS5 n=1 Tax=Candidatus Yonathbacteria bacterium RIFOXYD1_FULL_52_36 TaxID=1802730 RepID=A0A1G2SIF5_9BACT|nr:MAG: hypothetical protein A2408_01800 [Candidatus Yonathbacteria bacterium RIFOXYC1_FULL_52_10]OHA84867.1 MAG: hypothetical protein A2591_00895 [Candidatus Yonathbacteria bacterium RIFOXYD1_FULL_52_36]